MTRDQQLTSFGLFLQTARIEKKLSIEALSAETRIRVEVLKHLESEEHEQLPNEVFVRGFIRSYAIAVGADLEEALERYSASRALRHVRTDRKAAAQAKQSNRFWLGLGASVGAVLLMAGLTLYFYARLNVPAEMAVDAPQKPLMEQPAVPNQTPQADENASSRAAAAPRSVPPSPQTKPAPPKQYTLEIRAIEETWLKIIVDDQNAQEMTLQPNEVKQIQATSLFNLLIGNAGGVELKLDGASVEVSGRSGQVVNIQLP